MDHFGPTVLRVVVGATFVAHGAQKLFGSWGGGGLAGTAASFDSLGLSPGYPLAVAVGLTETRACAESSRYQWPSSHLP
jgi:putative oxidoreductase